jgi:hypothetical protein
MEAALSSETSEMIYHTARRHIQEDSNRYDRPTYVIPWEETYGRKDLCVPWDLPYDYFGSFRMLKI